MRLVPVRITRPLLRTTNGHEWIYRNALPPTNDMYSVIIDERYWREPSITGNGEPAGIRLHTANTLPVNGQSNGDTLPERIYRFLVANVAMGIPKLDAIAADFNVSPRSLQRQLRRAGISYRELADSVRKSFAVHYLRSGKYTIKEIAHRLGYTELSAFSRAFKRWTGTPPGDY